MWIALMLVHLFSNTGYNAVLRRAASAPGGSPGRGQRGQRGHSGQQDEQSFEKPGDLQIDNLLLSAIMSTAIAIPAAVGMAITGFDFGRYDLWTALGFAATVVTSVVFHIVNAAALKHTEASVFTFLYNLRIGIATLLGIFILGESADVLRLVGGGLIFAAGFVIIGGAIHGTSRKGIIISIGAALTIAVSNLIEKVMIMAVGYVNIIFPVAIISVIILWGIVFARRIPVSRKVLLSRRVLTLAPLRCTSAYGFTLALSMGALLSVSTYISSLSFITMTLVGIIFLKERDMLPSKIIATAVAFAGVTLILLS